MKAIDINWWEKLDSKWKRIFIDNYNKYYGSNICLESINEKVLYYINYMKEINCDGYGIMTLKPLIRLPYLKYISCNDNKIKSLKPLSNHVYLEILSINNNKINDLSPIENLIHLHYIYATKNNISKLFPLLNIRNLRSIYVIGNPLDLIEIENIKKVKSFDLILERIAVE